MPDTTAATASRALPLPFAPILGKLPGAAWVLLLLTVAFAAVGQGFLSTANLLNIGTQSTILLLIALPMTLIIMTEGLDLSMGAVLALCGVVLAMVIVATGSLLLALAAAIGVGLAFGLLNGLLVARLGIPPFVSTLGTLGVAQGVALVLTDGQSVVASATRSPCSIPANCSAFLCRCGWPLPPTPSSTGSCIAHASAPMCSRSAATARHLNSPASPSIAG